MNISNEIPLIADARQPCISLLFCPTTSLLPKLIVSSMHKPNWLSPCSIKRRSSRGYSLALKPDREAESPAVPSAGEIHCLGTMRYRLDDNGPAALRQALKNQGWQVGPPSGKDKEMAWRRRGAGSHRSGQTELEAGTSAGQGGSRIVIARTHTLKSRRRFPSRSQAWAGDDTQGAWELYWKVLAALRR